MPELKKKRGGEKKKGGIGLKGCGRQVKCGGLPSYDDIVKHCMYMCAYLNYLMVMMMMLWALLVQYKFPYH